MFKHPELPATIYYILKDFYTRHSLVFGTSPKRWFCKVWFPMPIQRIVNGRKVGSNASPIVLDFDHGIIRLRIVTRLTLPMPRWCIDRLREGANFRFALLGSKRDKPCLVLVAEKEAPTPYKAESILVIDVNSWKHGISWGLIKNGKIVSQGTERPNLRNIDTWYWKAVLLEQELGKLKRLGLHKTEKAKRIRREAKNLRRKIHAYLRDYVNKLVHKLVIKAVRNKAKIVIDDVPDISIRQLREELLDSGLAKIYLSGLRHFIDLLINQCKWYGIPVETRRLPSTTCPRCSTRLIEEKARLMKCPNCGLLINRDKVPIVYIVHVRT